MERQILTLCNHRPAFLLLVLVFAAVVYAPGVAQRPGRDRSSGTVTDATGRHSPRRHRGSAGRGGQRAGDRHRRDWPVHVQRSRPGDVRRDVHPLRLHRARAGGGGERQCHGLHQRGDGGRGIRRTGGRCRDPCPAAVGDRLGRAGRRHPKRGFRQPGQYGPGRQMRSRPLIATSASSMRTVVPSFSIQPTATRRPSSGQRPCAIWRRITR